MKLKIEQEGTMNEFTLINNWSDVTLEKWGKLVDFKKESPTEEALKTIRTLSDMPEQYIKALSIKDVASILSSLSDLQAEERSLLQRIIKVDGVELGFHPNLDEITLGEYADIEHLIDGGFEENIANIVAILYRPVIDKDGSSYTIEAYDGNYEERAKAIKNMKAEDVQSSLLFFWTFGSALSMTMQSYSMELIAKRMKSNLTEISQQDGDGSE
jgi:hypothetical protein